MDRCERCKRCGRWLVRLGGRVSDCCCVPFSILDEYDQDVGIWYEINAERVAEKYAEESSGANEEYLLDESVVITVVDSKGMRKRFKISAEATINYYAEEVEDEEK